VPPLGEQPALFAGVVPLLVRGRHAVPKATPQVS